MIPAQTRRPFRHELKLWTDQFLAMQLGAKRADVRRCDDREFRRGDEILYRDFAAVTETYSGMAMLARITHLTRAAGMLDLFGRDMTPHHQDDRATSDCILGSSRCSSPRTCAEAGRCLEAWQPTRRESPIVVLSIEVLEIGRFEALTATSVGELPPAPHQLARLAVGGPASSATSSPFFTCRCKGQHGKTGCSGTGATTTYGLCAYCIANAACCKASLPGTNP